LPALRKLLFDGAVKPNEQVVLFNTGSGVKYVESFMSEPRADRGPHAGSPRGVVVATGS
jgi:hypothetical protein